MGTGGEKRESPGYRRKWIEECAKKGNRPKKSKRMKEQGEKVIRKRRRRRTQIDVKDVN